MGRSVRVRLGVTVLLASLFLVTVRVTEASMEGPVSVRVYSGGAPRIALTQCAAAFEKARGHKIELLFDGVSGIRDRLHAGERPDVVLLPIQMMETFYSTLLRADRRVVLARSPLGVAVRRDAVLPNVSSPEAFRAAVLAARSIAYSDPKLAPSGVHLGRVLEQLGVADTVRPKTILKTPFDGGVELVARGEAELGVYLVTEIRMTKGVTLAGLLPPELQTYVVYAGGVAAHSPVSAVALEFLSFLTTDEARKSWEAAGFEPIQGDESRAAWR
jgi:molybdate transport system substrate-binding protein